MRMRDYLRPIAALALLAASGLAGASLPPPTPAQAQAAAAKKAAADAQAAKDKQELAASVDAVTAHWRARAAAQGWHTNPAVAVAAPPKPPAGATAAPAGTTPAAASAPPTPAKPPPPMPIKSEKFGTAPPSEDVKKKP